VVTSLGHTIDELKLKRIPTVRAFFKLTIQRMLTKIPIHCAFTLDPATFNPLLFVEEYLATSTATLASTDASKVLVIIGPTSAIIAEFFLPILDRIISISIIICGPKEADSLHYTTPSYFSYFFLISYFSATS
jgi:hypothetical protein